MTFHLATFGDLRLVDALSGETKPFPEKGLIIFAYLFSSDKQDISRAKLARLIWGDGDTSKAYANLRQTIARIDTRQKELGAVFLTTDDQTARLDRNLLSCDFMEVLHHHTDDPMADLDAVMSAMRSRFLENATLSSSALEGWVEEYRDRHIDRLREALSSAGPAACSQRDLRLIKDAALKVFEARPGDVHVREILRKAYDAEGHLDKARALFEDQQHRSPSDVSGRTRVLGASSGAPKNMHLTSHAPPSDTPLALMRPTMPRIALMQPKPNGETPSLAGLAASLIEDITIGLCVLKTVAVVAPYTAAQISRQANKAIALQRHAVSYFLETSISPRRGVPSLFAQLIYFPSDEVIWAETFSLEFGELPVQRNEISKRIAVIIAAEIDRNELRRADFERSPAAYQHYLIGQQLLKKLTLPEIRRARKAFREALQEDPQLCPALSGMARTYSREWLMTARGDVELLKLSEQFAVQAIQAGEDLAAGYRELGVANLYLGKFDESVAALDTAETLTPHYADVIADYADTLVHSSRPADGLRKIEQAIDLNPLPPDIYLWGAAGASFCVEQYTDALGYLERMKDRSPADRLTAATYAMLGDARSASTYVRKSKEVHPGFDVDIWLSIVPFKEAWQKDHYRTALKTAGF